MERGGSTILSHWAVGAFQTHQRDWPHWSLSRSKNSRWENQVCEFSFCTGKQRSLEPFLKCSWQVNLVPFSDPSVRVTVCSGFTQRKQGREEVCSGFRAAGPLDSACTLLFHAAGAMALVLPRLQVKRVQRLQVTDSTVGRNNPEGCLQAMKLGLNCTSALGPQKNVFMVFYL